MEEGKKFSNRKLVIVFGVLIGVVVALIVAIVVVNLNINNSKNDENNELSNTDVLNKTSEIEEKIGTDPDYLFTDAVAEYESGIENSTGEVRIAWLAEYANFMYDYGEDINAVFEIIKRGENYLDNDDVAIYYYGAALNIYEKLGDEEMINHCNQKLNELVPENTQNWENMEINKEIEEDDLE